MKICQVVTGLIPVPNDKWGATEKVMWNYKLCLDNMDASCDTKYLNDVSANQYDIVHIHMANLAIEAKRRGIPYIFSIHDHHVEYHGKGSFIYNQNLEAIKGSVFSITHAEHYIDLFDETDKLFYLSHGVNTSFYTPKKKSDKSNDIRLLMVANNGLAGDYSIDRKGFEIGINSAKELNLPITIIGAEANEQFFKIRKDLLEYEHLSYRYDNPSDHKILHAYHTHHIFLHPSMLEAGHPNLTLLEAMSCNLEIVSTFKGSATIPRMIKVEDLSVESFVSGIKKAIEVYNGRKDESIIYKEYDWMSICRTLYQMYNYSIKNKEVLSTEMIKNKYTTSYKSLINDRK